MMKMTIFGIQTFAMDKAGEGDGGSKPWLVLQQILINLLGNEGHPTVRAALCRRFDHCEIRSVVVLDKRSAFALGGSSPSLGCGHQEDDALKLSGNFQLITW
ncbi:hypothetical protein F3Y22_tig00001120pilonHSYRG00148 [Hibiscus syriacus]|uniref:Uncharacterized protein n=1 Tax=Hibiscus syriacus TaxID=106335 RepID=A0A6A3D199_HIBSY|nr:hypothetical protein F3Y22_tig00001120pilonHSYRG00148 [Hibiscus syriacus]